MLVKVLTDNKEECKKMFEKYAEVYRRMWSSYMGSFELIEPIIREEPDGVSFFVPIEIPRFFAFKVKRDVESGIKKNAEKFGVKIKKIIFKR